MKKIAILAFSMFTLAAVPGFAQDDVESPELLSARLDAANAQLAKAKAELDVLERKKQDAAARKARAAAVEKANPPKLVAQVDADKVAAYPEPIGVYDDDQPLPVVKIPANKKFDPLRLKVIMRFPANVKTIQQATQYMLETVDYKLTLNPLDPEETKKILSRPLMAHDRNGSMQTIEDGLLQISGDDTVLIIDRNNKLISFELQNKKTK